MLPEFPSLPGWPTDFGFANLHNHVNKFLKITLLVYTDIHCILVILLLWRTLSDTQGSY